MELEPLRKAQLLCKIDSTVKIKLRVNTTHL